MGRRELIGAAAFVLAITGVIGLGLHRDPVSSPVADAASTSSSLSSTTAAPTSTSVSLGTRHHAAQPHPVPADTWPPVSVEPPVAAAPEPVPDDAPAAVVTAPTCGQPLRLSVLRVEGCPVSGIVDLVTGITQEAAAPPE